MRSHVFVYSADSFFIKSFSSYVMGNGRQEFSFSFYTEEAAAEGALNRQTTEVVLADADFLWRCGKLSGIQGNSTECVWIAIGEQTRFQPQNGVYELNVYQRGKDILGDIRKILSGESGNELKLGEKTQKLISFYSPQGGSGKTTLAYICALLGARDKTSVYLNLEEFAYTDHLYQMSFGVSMEEILYQVKDNRDVSILLSEAIRRDARNVSVLPVIQNIRDYTDITSDNLLGMLEKLMAVSEAEYLFVDLSGGMSERNRAVMERSDAIFQVFADNAVGRGKLERMRNDRSLQGEPFYQCMHFVLNQCRAKGMAEDMIQIPFSKSLSEGVDVELALSGNRDLYQSCMEMMRLLEE